MKIHFGCSQLRMSHDCLDHQNVGIAIDGMTRECMPQ
jgi:hypothetical protein